jgi:hypothetical protein
MPAGATRESAQPAAFREPWRWFTFPVFAAFVSGAFLVLLIAPATNTPLYTVLFFGFLAGVAFSLLHVLVRWLRSR